MTSRSARHPQRRSHEQVYLRVLLCPVSGRRPPPRASHPRSSPKKGPFTNNTQQPGSGGGGAEAEAGEHTLAVKKPVPHHHHRPTSQTCPLRTETLGTGNGNGRWRRARVRQAGRRAGGRARGVERARGRGTPAPGSEVRQSGCESSGSAARAGSAADPSSPAEVQLGGVGRPSPTATAAR